MRILLSLLLAAALGWGGPALARVVDRVAAVVNKEVITLSEIYDLGADFIEARAAGEGPDGPQRREAELEVLDTLIQRSLIEQEIRRLDLDVTRDELERSLDDVARQNGLERSELKAEVERAGYDWAVYRKEMEQNIRQMKFSQIVIRPRVQVTEDEVLSLYRRRIKELAGTGGARVVEGILLPWPSDEPEERAALAMEAQSIVERAGDTDWAELVAEYPDSPFYAAGGEMGTFERGELAPELDAVVFSTPVGQIADPVALDSGIVVIHLVSEAPTEVPAFEDMREELELELLDQKMERELEVWYSQARRQALVDIKLETP